MNEQEVTGPKKWLLGSQIFFLLAAVGLQCFLCLTPKYFEIDGKGFALQQVFCGNEAIQNEEATPWIGDCSMNVQVIIIFTILAAILLGLALIMILVAPIDLSTNSHAPISLVLPGFLKFAALILCCTVLGLVSEERSSLKFDITADGVNLRTLQAPESINHGHFLPVSITAIIAIAFSLGFHYLWYDSLTIVKTTNRSVFTLLSYILGMTGNLLKTVADKFSGKPSSLTSMPVS